MKIQPFSPIFPLAGFTDKAFCRLSLWNFKEKASTIFYGSVMACGCFISTARWKDSLFYNTASLFIPLAVLKFPADTQSEGVHLPPVSVEHSLPWRRTHFQRGERHPPATADGASSRAASPLSIALRGTFGRSSPLHAALPCGGGRPQSSLALVPPAVKGAYFSLSTVNLNRTIPLGCVVDYIIYWN